MNLPLTVAMRDIVVFFQVSLLEEKLVISLQKSQSKTHT